MFILYLFLSFGMLVADQKKEAIVLIADPRVLTIPIKENHDPLVSLLNQKELRYGPSPEVPNNKDYTNIRKTVYEKLLKAQKRLPKEIVFCLYDGHRSLKLQGELFDQYYKKMKEQHPSFNHKELFEETLKLVSPVKNLDGSQNVPPHSTGGAIDVYLVNKNGEVLDMGIHPKDWQIDLTGEISQTNSKVISKTAQKNRQIMNEALRSVGFVNYPTEYWHWSYGDRYWAYQSKTKEAIYGGL